MSLNPTAEQLNIIQDSGNCVVIAKPGSGKTFTLVCKISQIIQSLPHYKGIIAISFTNKASDELIRRCISMGINRRESFFGTIDGFFLTEMIFPFGKNIFGVSENRMEVIKIEELEQDEGFSIDQCEDLEFLGELYRNGKIVLERIDILALYIFDRSQACRRYIKARYTHIIIDEYQDCGKWQHELFMRLVYMGLVGIAVGDIDQSIFGFAGKSPKYLLDIARNTDLFHSHILSYNHRCHQSIVNYSNRLLIPSYVPEATKQICVFDKKILGSEIDQARWLSDVIPKMSVEYGVEKMNRVAILVKNRLTGNIIHRNLTIPHKSIIRTPLDEDSSQWGLIFRRVLLWAFSSDQTKYELVESYIDVVSQAKIFRQAMNILCDIKQIASNNPMELINNIDLFEQIAYVFCQYGRNTSTMIRLSKTLSSSALLDTFIPPDDEEVQLMTIHKSKGLEFDIVFHLNMHRWILPQHNGDWDQDLSLHYVGITRAKKCCVLCSSTHRHRKENELIKAEDSEFMNINNLHLLRLSCEF